MIRILALDDDTHDLRYVGEDKWYGYKEEFIAHLAKPHTEEYEIRYVYAVNYYDEVPGFTEAFDLLAITDDPQLLADIDFPKFLERLDGFDAMWDMVEGIQ